MTAKRVQHRGALCLVTLFGLAGVLGVSSATATGSGLVGASQQRFKIAYTHSSGRANGDLFVMSADGSGQRNLSRHPAFDSDPAWSPDGRRIAFVSTRDGKQEINVVNTDGSGLRNLTRSPGHDFRPAWSPDGRKILFIRSSSVFRGNDVGVFVMDADGSGQRRLTYPKGRGDGNPALFTAVWSPDGRRIVFTPKRGGNWELYVMNADGSGQRNLTQSPAYDSFPTWLPDGRIVFFSDRDGNFALYVMNADGSGLRNLTREWGIGWGPVTWSPGGQKVAFQDNDGWLYVMNTDASGRRKLAKMSGGQQVASLSPDGRRIAFTKYVGNWERGSEEIFAINTDGSGLQRLTRRTGNDYGPVWSPAQTG